MTKTGWVTQVTGGMTVWLLWVQLIIHQVMLIWFHQVFGWLEAESARSRVVMTITMYLLLKPKEIVWVDKRFDPKSQVMATLETARFGPVTGAWEAARFNMADSTRQQTGFNRLSVVATSKVTTRSASGVTGIVVMDQWWWLVEEEVAVTVLITGLE